jgi:triosephosphate isomerase
MRVPVFAANWKMYKTVQESTAFVREFAALAKRLTGVELIVAPPFTAIAAAAELARNTPIDIAGQDVYFEREGAFTGEISAAMLADAGATHVIVGHSERRRLFGETDEWVNRKARAAVTAELTPIICIGETLQEREHGSTLAVLDQQIRAALDGLSADQIGRSLIAYEPVWAIGTGETASPADASAMHRVVRETVEAAFGAERAGEMPVLYGGSVKPENAAELLSSEGVDGVLVGGASLDPAGFAAICAAAPA